MKLLDGQDAASAADAASDHSSAGEASDSSLGVPMSKNEMSEKEWRKFWAKMEAKGKSGSQLKGIPDKTRWVSFVNEADVEENGMIASGSKHGHQIAIVNEKGVLYAISNTLPPTGQPATFGILDGDGSIKEPISGTKFSLRTGKLVGDWCPSLIGGLQSMLVAPRDVQTFDVRRNGNAVEVLINVNLKKQSEQTYHWREVLKSQRQIDGPYPYR
jgi:nitrite reductase/ring-hydroxylating ferredoxin subunit